LRALACHNDPTYLSTLHTGILIVHTPQHKQSTGRELSTQWAFVLLAVVQATLIFTITLIAVPLPDIGHEFGLDTSSLILVNAAYGLSFSGLLLLGGRLADRYGGRRIFTAGLLFFGLASAAAAFSPHFMMLVTVRFMQGVGAAMVAPAALAILRNVFPDPAAFGRAMAVWGGVSVLGATIGTVISGAMTTWISWRWMFLVPVLVSCITLLLMSRLLPKDHDISLTNRPGQDVWGGILATLGISIASYGLIFSSSYGWSSPAVQLPLLLGSALLVAFSLVERRVKAPLLPPGFILESRRLAGLIGILLAAASMGLVTFLLSLYLQQEKGWSPLETALGFLPYMTTLIATGRITAALIERFGADRIMVSGLLLGAAGLALLTGISRESSYMLGLLPGLVILPLGTSFVFASSAVITTINVPSYQAGLAGGVMNTAMELGPTVGLAFFMSIAALQSDVIRGYAWALGAASAVFIAAALLSMVLTKRAEPEGEVLPADIS
jgi:MFS family permease